MTKEPSAAVRTSREKPVIAFDSSTDAEGNAAPLASTTVPFRVPAPIDCAARWESTGSSSHKHANHGFIMILNRSLARAHAVMQAGPALRQRLQVRAVCSLRFNSNMG